jgi:adenylate kinase
VTGDSYHVEFDMPDDEDVRERLVQREDDAEETVRERLRVYRENTAPVVEHYRETGRLETVDGEGTPDEVFAAVRDVIEGDGSE